MALEEKEFRLGDLVIYRRPRQFFSSLKGKNVIGFITEIDAFHVKVFWEDGLWCLESMEDVSCLQRTN